MHDHYDITAGYRLASRTEHPEDTVIEIKRRKIGGGGFTVIAGPCSIESEEQICRIAEQVKDSGADMLRGGAYKPRTSPYDFQGLGERGLKYLAEAGRITGLPTVSEIVNERDLDEYVDIDILQVGTRSMQDYSLLKALGRAGKPVLLKRGQSATYKEFLCAAEYILAGGNSQVILCERGIRTFEPYTRSTLDIQSVPALKELTHLPVIVDPSHASGRSELIEPMSYAAAAAGADGLIIEVHDRPEEALSDGRQSIKPDVLKNICGGCQAVRKALNRQ